MNTSKLKVFSALALFLIGLIAISGIVNADSVPVNPDLKVYINDRLVDDGEVRGGIYRGDIIDIEVKIEATGDDDNVVIEASVDGIDHDSEKAVERTDPFSIKANKTYYKTLSIELPDRMDIDQYALRIQVSNRADDEVVYNAVLEIESVRNGVTIKDVVFNPGTTIKAGRALLTTARLKNVGEDTEDDIKVVIEVPELGISASDYIDEVEAEDSVTSEELYMRIPDCAKAGAYMATVTAIYDEGDEEVSQEFIINVLENEACEVPSQDNQDEAGKTVITISTETQTVTAGESGVLYPLTITNTGSSAKTYAVSTVVGDWADVKVNPSVAVVGAGETKIVYVTVAAKEDASAGAQTFGVAIKSGDATLKEVTLSANVDEKADSWGNVKKGLEVALVVLVVLLVIIGLIIGFSKLKGSEDEEEAKEETYY